MTWPAESVIENDPTVSPQVVTPIVATCEDINVNAPKCNPTNDVSSPTIAAPSSTNTTAAAGNAPLLERLPYNVTLHYSTVTLDDPSRIGDLVKKGTKGMKKPLRASTIIAVAPSPQEITHALVQANLTHLLENRREE